eukprot:557369-Rhodomonas_salina.1
MVDLRPNDVVSEDIEDDDFFPPSASSDLEDSEAAVPVKYDETEMSEEERDPNDIRNFPVCDQTMDALAQRGITKLFPVQSATFNEIYNGRDVLARARTGTGKTMGFALPILERIIQDKIETGNIRRKRGTKASCIIMSPT